MQPPPAVAPDADGRVRHAATAGVAGRADGLAARGRSPARASGRVPRFAAALAVTAVLALTGCAGAPHGSATTSTATAAAPTASATASASAPAVTPSAAPVLVPDGSAQDNLPLFRAVVERVWAGPDQVHGRAYVDALAAAGFDKAAMQVTEDESTVGNPAESIQFSVRWHDGQCLIGQVGPDTGAPVTTVLPGLADGKCLLGATRTIDW